MTTQLDYTVNYPTATPGTEDFSISISVENRNKFPVTLNALQVYLPMGEGENDLTPLDDYSSITTDSPLNWKQTTQTDKSGGNVEVTFSYDSASGYVINPNDPALTFKLGNITVNESYGIANCKLVEFTNPYVANSEYDFSISKPITPPSQLSFTPNPSSIDAGGTVVFSWVGPSGWTYTISHDGIIDCSTTHNEGTLALTLYLTTVVTLQLTQTDQTPPTPVQITIQVTPTVSLVGTAQQPQSNQYQLALNWTSSGAIMAYGSWDNNNPIATSGSQIVPLSLSDVQSKSCADFTLTADGSDTQASCPCAIALPVINSFVPTLLSQDATVSSMTLNWDVLGAFYVEGSWTSPDSAPFNPSDHSAVINAQFASEYTITAYVLSDVKKTKTIQMADFFPAPVIQQFSFVVDGDSLVVNWEVLSPNAPVYSLWGSWQPALSPSLPLTGSLTLNSPFEPIYTLTVEGLVENQSMTRRVNTADLLWRQASTVESVGGFPFAISAMDNQTYFVNYRWNIGYYSISAGLLSLFSLNDYGQITSLAITPNLKYILILEIDTMGLDSFVRGYDVNTFAQTNPQPVIDCFLPYMEPGYNITPIVITPDNSSVYVAYIGYLTMVDLAQNLPNTLELSTYGCPEPAGIAITPDGNYVLIAFANGYVITVEVASFSQLNTIAVGQNPCAIAITPNNQHAFVACSGDDTVSVIDLSSFTVTAILPVGTKPESLAITPDGNYVFVGNTGSDTVSVIDAT
jgi:YVTN family beta-propeller protein